MTETSQRAVHISSETDILTARQAVREAASQLHFGVTDTVRIVTAVSELARNIVRYAGSGTMQCFLLNHGAKVGIEVRFEDHGAGIPDVNLALQPGFSTSNGLGLGLPGAKRLTDEMEIESEIGRGTRVTIRKWLRK